MLIDSNIIIYACKPEHPEIRWFIAEHAPYVSAVSYVEVLGFHGIAERERCGLEAFFAATKVLPITDPILREAVRLRQAKKMSLGDSLLAGTALVHGLTLVTRNASDFKWIDGLTLFNPFDAS